MRHGKFLIAAQTGADVCHVFLAPRCTSEAVMLCRRARDVRYYSTQAGDGRRVCLACARRWEKLRRGA